MMASLYQSPSPARLVSALMSVRTFMVSQQATEQQRRILVGLDAKPHATPFDHVLLAGDKVLDRAHTPAAALRADLDFSEVEPELARATAVQRDGNSDRVIA